LVTKSGEAISTSNNLELKPNYICIETSKDNVKFYYAVLYMPMTCVHMLRKVNPKNAFIKKKDAENHVALLAIKKLKDRGYIDEYLFPVDPSQQLATLLLSSSQFPLDSTRIMSVNSFYR